MKRLIAGHRRKKALKRFRKAIRALLESDLALCLRAMSRGLLDEELDDLVARCGEEFPAKDGEADARRRNRLRSEVIGVLMKVEV